jgi:hypothetical protein
MKWAIFPRVVSLASEDCVASPQREKVLLRVKLSGQYGPEKIQTHAQAEKTREK